MKINVMSDKGVVRDKNQDSIKMIERNDGAVLVVVCDGIGGAKAGEIASQMAVNALANSFVEHTNFHEINQLTQWFDEILQKINHEIVDASKQNLNYQGMGTTLVAVVLTPSFSLAVNIGDSRIYRLSPQHELLRISHDHSLVFEMVERGEISEAEANEHPQRNYLTNALGISDSVRIDSFDLSRHPWDVLLLCSDGLHGYVEEHMIRRVLLNQKMSNDEKCQTLVDLANEVGGYDNVSVALVTKEDVA